MQLSYMQQWNIPLGCLHAQHRRNEYLVLLLQGTAGSIYLLSTFIWKLRKEMKWNIRKETKKSLLSIRKNAAMVWVSSEIGMCLSYGVVYLLCAERKGLFYSGDFGDSRWWCGWAFPHIALSTALVVFDVLEVMFYHMTILFWWTIKIP